VAEAEQVVCDAASEKTGDAGDEYFHGATSLPGTLRADGARRK
jgi:hypothetical protein